MPLGRPALSSGEIRREAGAPALRRAVETRMLDRHAPAHVVINRDGDVLHYSPRTGKYLEAAAGLPNRQLVAMARRGLRLELRGALREALEGRRAVTRRNVTVEIDERLQPIDLIIEPLTDDEHDPLFLVVFHDLAPSQTPQELLRLEAAGDRNADRLEQELRDTRERLQSTIEEYETAVEELKSSNEELQSMNEELQSTNEEMETAKEELQSVNEELHTINAELNSKVEEVDRAHADLRNLFESTQIATIFLDHDLVIRSFTPAAAGLFNLISGDRGRPLTDIVSNLRDEGDLKREIQLVLETGEILERRVRRKDNADHYLMRILPYRTRPNQIDGVLVTFVQVTRMVEAEAQQRTMIEELNHRVRNMLTVIGAIAKQTLKKSDSPAHFTEAFLGRLQAMANSYSLIAREQWGDVPLADVLKGELASHDSARVTLEGPPISFKPSQAVALGLVVHELATNAAKYGALADPEGRLAVAWRAENGRVLLDWTESDGPKVTPPQRRGFGTDLIERQVASALDGEISLDYAPAGLRIRISLPAPVAKGEPAMEPVRMRDA
jgi:two-component system CheB/CheR fusion protein